VELEGSALLADAHGVRARVELLRESFDSQADVDPVWLRAALSLSDEWLLGDGQLMLVPALRLEQAGPFLLLSPKLGAILQLPGGFSLRANAGQSHRAPSFLELYVSQGGLLANPELQPERALTADLGLERAGEKWRASATGFYSLYENLITYELYPPAAPRPHNFPGADVWGTEVWGSYVPGPWLSTSASWTLLFSRNLRDDPRYYLKELPFRPRHSLMLRAEVGPTLLRGRVQVEAQSEQFMNKTGNALEKLPGRAFLHLGLSSLLPLPGPRLTASLEVRNVLNTQGQDFRGYPLTGRAAFLTLSASLDGDSTHAGLSTQEQ
jgi:iron complex outermembrane receptor protein